MTPRAVFLSIQPTYGDRILAGTKTYELRRRPPRQAEQAVLLLYLSSPVRALVGVARVRGLILGSPEEIWAQVAPRAGVSRPTFNDYFAGVAAAGALEIADPSRLAQPIPLAELRRIWPGFNPPQSFRYLYEGHGAGALVLSTPWGRLDLAIHGANAMGDLPEAK